MSDKLLDTIRECEGWDISAEEVLTIIRLHNVDELARVAWKDRAEQAEARVRELEGKAGSVDCMREEVKRVRLLLTARTSQCDNKVEAIRQELEQAERERDEARKVVERCSRELDTWIAVGDGDDVGTISNVMGELRALLAPKETNSGI